MTTIEKRKKWMDLDKLNAQANPVAFKSNLDLSITPKFNDYGDNIDPIIKSIPIHSIDEYQFNPRQADNNHFAEIKESIQSVGLQQRFSITRDPETKRYTLVKGGNTRLRAYKELYRETGDTKFSVIDCIVEPWNGELNKTQAVIAHLIENEARGELMLVDKARALIELEGEFKANLNNKKESDHSSDSQDNNYKTKQTVVFIEYLKNNGYSVSEKQLGLFRFTATRLTGHLDNFLNQGMGSPQIIKIRSVYNNLKHLAKDKEYQFNDIDHYFSESLKKYNKTKKPFEFDGLLDIIVGEIFTTFIVHSAFIDNKETFKEALLSARKTKDDNIDPNNHTEGIGTQEQGGYQEKDNTDAKLDNGADVDANQNDENAKTDESMGSAATNFVDGETDGAAPTKLGAATDTGISVPINMNLSYQRRNAYNLVKKIVHKIYIDTTVVPIDVGCGFLLVDIVPKSKASFENWGIWWLLLGYSHAVDLLHPIIDFKKITEEGKPINLDINKDLLVLYNNVCLKNEAVDMNLEFINEQTGMYEYRSPNLQSVKDRLVPSLWQDVTELEACCYQIMRVVNSDESIKLWSN